LNAVQVIVPSRIDCLKQSKTIKKSERHKQWNVPIGVFVGQVLKIGDCANAD
jgi:hypothetical protein